jgi:hypothetical protein
LGQDETIDAARYLARTRVVRLCIGLFVLGVALAMWNYPGGTWWDRACSGHSFWENFLCDLLHDPALNQMPNRTGSALATAAILIFIVGLGVFWSMAHRWLDQASIAARWMGALGVFGAVSLAFVPLTPSNHFPRLHTTAVLLGGLPALTTFLLFCVSLVRQGRIAPLLRLFTAILGLLVVMGLGLYAQHVIVGGPSLRVLPLVERLAVIMLLGWMLVLLRLEPENPRR